MRARVESLVTIRFLVRMGVGGGVVTTTINTYVFVFIKILLMYLIIESLVTIRFLVRMGVGGGGYHHYKYLCFCIYKNIVDVFNYYYV